MINHLPKHLLLCGKGQIAVNALRYTLSFLQSHNLDCSLMVCPNSEDKGYETWYPSLLAVAKSLGVTVLKEVYEYSSEPGLVLIALEYDKIIWVDRFISQRLYNFHFSKLPKYRGVYTSIWPILNGETESGVTLHTIKAGIDDGDIVDQIVFPIGITVTAKQLYQLYMDYAFELYQKNLRDLIFKPIQGIPQDHSQASYYSRRSLDFSKDSRISFDLTSDEIIRKVRAFYFPEYQVARFDGRGVRQAWIVGSSSQAPGSKLAETSMSAVYVASDGVAVELVWA